MFNCTDNIRMIMKIDMKTIFFQAFALFKRDKRLFFFIFPIVLFSSNGELDTDTNELVDKHADHFMKLLTKYILVLICRNRMI